MGCQTGASPYAASQIEARATIVTTYYGHGLASLSRVLPGDYGDDVHIGHGEFDYVTILVCHGHTKVVMNEQYGQCVIRSDEWRNDAVMNATRDAIIMALLPRHNSIRCYCW